MKDKMAEKITRNTSGFQKYKHVESSKLTAILLKINSIEKNTMSIKKYIKLFSKNVYFHSVKK